MQRLRFSVPAVLGVFLLALGSGARTQDGPYDLVIRNGRVLDGSGNPYVYADVGIKGDTIVAIGDLKGAVSARTIDASAQYVTPGFFAMHEHIETDVLEGHGTLANFTTQGFTTAGINMDGRTAVWPVAKQHAACRAACSSASARRIAAGSSRRC